MNYEQYKLAIKIFSEILFLKFVYFISNKY